MLQVATTPYALPQERMFCDFDDGLSFAASEDGLQQLIAELSSDIPSTSTPGSCEPSVSGQTGPSKPAKVVVKRRRDRSQTARLLVELEAKVQRAKVHIASLTKENEDLRYKQDVYERLVNLRTQHLHYLQGYEAVSTIPLPAFSPPQAVGLDAPLHTLAPANFQEKDMNPNEFQRMGKLQLMRFWKANLSDASMCLLSLVQNADNTVAEAKLKALCTNVCFVLRGVAYHNNKLMSEVMSLQLDVEQPGVASPEHWVQVLAAINLTPAQQRDLVAVHSVYLKAIHMLFVERRPLQDKLAAGSAAAAEARREVVARRYPSYHLEPLASFSSVGEVRLGAEYEVIDALCRSLGKEAVLNSMICGFLFGHCITIRQFAQLCAHSYPFMPDSVAIIDTLARQVHAQG